jgi:hypothetical protein
MLFITSVKAYSMISLQIIGRIIVLFLLKSASVCAVYIGKMSGFPRAINTLGTE